MTQHEENKQRKVHIIVDTREQHPLFVNDEDFGTVRPVFSSLSLRDEWLDKVVLHRDKLDCGDYTMYAHDLPGDDHSIVLERKKDCMELITNLVTKWDQFASEMELLRQYKHKQIIVCKPENFWWLYQQGFTAVHPNFLYKKLAVLYYDFGVPVTFLGSRMAVEAYMYSFMKDVMNKALYG